MLKRYSAGATGQPQRARGFTLIELMVVVVIVGILAAITYPAYQEQVRKSKRSDAKNSLADLASRQQQYFADNKTYADTLAKLGWTGTASREGYYTIDSPISTTTAVSGGVTYHIAYTLTARGTGAQASDTKCATFSLTSAGKKTSTGGGTNCW